MRDGHFFTAFETLHAFLIVERLLTHFTHKSGVSLTQFRVLLELDQRSGMTLAGSLADALLLAPPSITYAINGLEKKGLVVRARPHGDRRSVAITATPDGQRVYRNALARVEAVFTTDVRRSTRRERDAYKDAAMIMVSALQKRSDLRARTG